MVREVLSKELAEICTLSDTKDAKKYCYFRISDGKSWLLPCSSYQELKVGLAIYQPVGIKGIGFKALMPYLRSNKVFTSFIKKSMRLEIVAVSFRREFIDWITAVFNIEDPLLSFYLGMPSTIRKTTCQVSGKYPKILGYVKFSCDSNASHMIDVEADFLKKGWHNYKGIPVLLAHEAGFLNALTISAQTTNKTLKSSYTSVLTEQHLDFQRQLSEKTQVTLRYKSTQYFRNQQAYLKALENYTFAETKRTIECAVDVINREMQDSVVTFFAAHRDFKPFNICFTTGQILVFDWELVSEEYPPFYDIFGYLKFAMIIKKLAAEKSLTEMDTFFEKLNKEYEQYDSDTLKLYYLMYLTDSILLKLNLNPDSEAHKETDLIKAVLSTY